MVNDDQSAEDRLTDALGGHGLADGSPDWAGAPTEIYGAVTGQPVDGGDGSGRAGGAGGSHPGEPDDTLVGPTIDPDDAGDSTDKQPVRSKKARSAWRELPILIVVALAIALVIKTFIVQPFWIPSSSMEDTLMIGDKVLVNKLVYHFRPIEPGDIVVFNGAGSWDPATQPSGGSSNFVARAYDDTLRKLFDSIAGLFGTPVGQTDYIKRVIGVPGDTVACCAASGPNKGLVTVNGVALHESSYLYPGAQPSAIHFHIKVPPGRLWVMGDNRAISDDSRLRQSDPGHGTVPENMVIGRAFMVVWPPSQWTILSIPSTFDQPGIDKPARSAAATAASREAAQRATAELLRGVPVRQSNSYLAVTAGLAGAVPLTWLQRRARRRLAARRRRRTR